MRSGVDGSHNNAFRAAEKEQQQQCEKGQKRLKYKMAISLFQGDVFAGLTPRGFHAYMNNKVWVVPSRLVIDI